MHLAATAPGWAPPRTWLTLAAPAGDHDGGWASPRGASAEADATVEHAAATARIRMLGAFQVTAADGSRAEVPATRGDVLKYLAVRRHAHLEEVVDVVWPGLDPATGRRRLRNVLTRLRAACGPIIERDDDALVLRPDVAVDVHRFEDDASRALQLGFGDPRAVALAGSAVALYRGDLLPGDPYVDWTSGPRERLRRRFVALLDLLAVAAFQRGEIDEALLLLEQGIDLERYDEDRYLRAAGMLIDDDRRGAAAVMLRRGRLMLDELGISSSRRFLEVEDRLRSE